MKTWYASDGRLGRIRRPCDGLDLGAKQGEYLISWIARRERHGSLSRAYFRLPQAVYQMMPGS